MVKIWVLGAKGMLGVACYNYLSKFPQFSTFGISRNEYSIAAKTYPISMDINQEALIRLAHKIGRPEFIINAIGVIKPRIDDTNMNSVALAYKVNTVFPHVLDRFAEKVNAKVFQIGTDCVFSGTLGMYIETSQHDAQDHYGISKSLGETQTENTKIIRSSIIGRELENFYSLGSWVANQPQGATIKGFIDHNWNGVTTIAFAKIVHGLIESNIDLSELQHVIPKDKVTKFELVRMLSHATGRNDLTIEMKESGKTIDRTLDTLNQDKNLEIWRAAGYKEIPTISELIQHDY